MALNPLDLAVILAYLAGVTLFGLRFRAGGGSLRGYFLADRELPWWALSLSIVATETSTLTIISIPGLAYDTDFTFLQLALGYLVGRVVVSFVLIPQYFRGELFTAYQLIERRFGEGLRALTAGVFLATRAAAEGVRVFAVAIVIGIALGTDDTASVLIILLLTLAYTFRGGLRAVIWTDVVQIAVYGAGTLAALATIAHLVPGGWQAVLSTAGEAGKFRLFDFSGGFSVTYTFWAGLVGGAFLSTASHGADQLIVQRLLAARSRREAQTALLASGVLVLLQFALFLLVGAALFVFYRVFPAPEAFARSDRIFPTFIVEHMPAGLAGLMVAAVLAAAMSTLSSSLNSLSSTTIVDFYLRRRPHASERNRVAASRLATVFWAAVLFALALLSRGGGRVLEVGLAIASLAYGALLGVFLLGVLTRRANQTGAMIGMGCGLAAVLALWAATAVPWTWYVAAGTLVTFAIGYIASFAFSTTAQGYD
jgi:SSS family solute:Na+ symporter